jgi:hypothetical protein
VENVGDGCDACDGYGKCRHRAANHDRRGDAGTRSGAKYVARGIDYRHEHYKQNVYDPSYAKIGEISDVLVSKDGKIEALIVSVGGFLGLGEKDVAVPFSAIHGAEKNGSWYLTMNSTKDALKAAPGYKYDRAKATWVPA